MLEILLLHWKGSIRDVWTWEVKQSNGLILGSGAADSEPAAREATKTWLAGSVEGAPIVRERDEWRARAELAEASGAEKDYAAYREFAGQVSSILAPPDEGGIAFDHLSPADFPVLLDFLREQLRQGQAYREFAVNVSDLMEDNEAYRGLLMRAELPTLLESVRERLRRPLQIYVTTTGRVPSGAPDHPDSEVSKSRWVEERRIEWMGRQNEGEGEKG